MNFDEDDTKELLDGVLTITPYTTQRVLLQFYNILAEDISKESGMAWLGGRAYLQASRDQEASKEHGVGASSNSIEKKKNSNQSSTRKPLTYDIESRGMGGSFILLLGAGIECARSFTEESVGLAR